VVTTRAGNTSIQTPLSADGTITQKTSRGGETRTRVEPTKNEAEILKERAEADKEAKRLADEAKTASIARAKAEHEGAIANRAIAADKEARVIKDLEDGEAEVNRRKSIAVAEEENYRRSLEDFTGAKKTFWSRQDTSDKIKGGLALVLGLFGGIKDGSNVGADRIMKAIEDDSENYRVKMEARKEILERSRTDVSAAKEEIKRKLELTDIRSAAALDRVANEAVERGKRLGISEAELAGNQEILKLRQGAIDKRQAHEEKLRTNVSQEQAWNKVTTTSTGGAGGTNDPRLKASDEALNTITATADAVKELDNALATSKANPEAWTDYAKNDVDWRQAQAWDKIPGAKQIRALGQGAGAFDVAPEQGLAKNQPALGIHRAITAVKSALQKARGGAITDADISAVDSELAQAAAMNPAEGIKLIQGIRNRLENKLKAYVANRQVTLPPGILPGTGTGGAAPSVPVGTRKQTANGKTWVMTANGWQLAS
jgi:hypothetical protein